MDENTKMLVEELAGQIGIAAKEAVDFIWPILVWQAQVEGVTRVILYTLLIIVLFIYIRYLRSERFEEIFEKFMANTINDADFIVFIMFAFGIFLFVFTLIGLLELQGTITRFINPEFHALETIFKSVK